MKNGNSIFAVLAEALEKNKKLRTILYAVLIILALDFFDVRFVRRRNKYK